MSKSYRRWPNHGIHCIGHDDSCIEFVIDCTLLNIYNQSMMNTTTEYKTIPTSFKKKGFVYNQLKREGKKAIFQQTRMGSTISNYEVVKIGRHNGYVMGGVTIEPAETYPGSSLWGITGWTCTSIDEAMKRYEGLDS